jgi:hypothetical protein
MTTTRLTTLLLVLSVAAGCQEGGVVQVTIDTDPANPPIMGVRHVKVDGAATLTNHQSQTTTHSFDVADSSTPLTFGIAVPPSFLLSSMSITVELIDASGTKTLARGIGTGTVHEGVTPIPVTVIEPSNCTADSTSTRCDGFEGLKGDGGFASFWSGPPVTDGSPDSFAKIDTTHARRGTHSLHVQTAAVGVAGATTYATVGETSFIPTGTLFVRAFVYVPSKTFDLAPGAIFLFSQAASPYAQIELSLDPSASGFFVFDSVDGSQQHTNGVTLTPDTWTCVEWQVSLGNPGVTNVWVDDTKADGLLMGVKTMPAMGGPFNRVAVGLVSTLIGTQTRDYWIDEVMIGNGPDRIGCDK